jgi:hypothetical protein
MDEESLFILTVLVGTMMLVNDGRLKHYVYEIEMKNLMERFIQHIKDRTECFDDHFPRKIRDCDRHHI